MSTLIYGGRVVDPANRVDAKMNLCIERGKIRWAGDSMPEADEKIDASGCIVTPGWIDIHMHEDPVDAEGHIEYSIFENMLRMGVTTVLAGNCGINVYDPVKYLRIVDREGAPVNVAMLAGHEFYRTAAGASDKYAAATEGQCREMASGLRRALDAGCLGVSFGLRYVPGTDQREFYAAVQCCREGKKMIAAHVRDDADAVLESIREVSEAGRKFGLPVQISHIGSMGGFGQMEQVLRQVDADRLNGLDIALDCYPYAAFSTKIGETTYDDGWLERYHCDYGVLEYCEGKYKGQRATAETFAEMRRDFPECVTVCHVMKPQDVERALSHPAVMLASDGMMDKGQGHPRAAGTFPRLFSEYVKRGILSGYEAVEKMTALPAQRMGLKNKGRLNVGADADVTIFDPRKIRDCATFAEPSLPPKGIRRVLMGGETAVLDGKIVNGRLGRAVRG